MTTSDNGSNNRHSLRCFAVDAASGIKKSCLASGRPLAREIQSDLRKIKETDRLCSDYSEKNTSVPQEMEWLQDNWYLAEKLGRFAAREFSESEKLPASAQSKTVISAAADAYVRYENGKVSEQLLGAFLDAFQSETVLSEHELYLFVPAIAASLVHFLADMCEKIRLLCAGKECGSFAETMKNIFTSFRFLETFDPSETFKKVNRVENILAADPVGIYPMMDDETRHSYRKAVTRLAEKTGSTEHDTASEVVFEAQRRKIHVGKVIAEKTEHLIKKDRAFSYYFVCVCVFSLVAAAAAAIGLKSIIAGLILLLPISEAVKNTIDFIILKTVKPKRLPRLEFEGGIPDEGKTVCVISALLSSKDSAEKSAELLEKYRLLNRGAGENLKFGILADLPESDTETSENDGAVLSAAEERIKSLNTKYGGGFYLFTRKRVYSAPHGCFMGWERKRGAVYSLAMLLGGRKSELNCACGDFEKLSGAKYILTLDSDTRLSADSASELVSTALHPLNRAVTDRRTRTVKAGYGILQPRISVELNAANRSDFTRIFAGQGGTDPYGSVASDLYQDMFGEGSFNGKGLIDIEAYCTCMASRLPENAVLSHDLLEGAYLKCGYVSDVELTDGYPYKILSYFSREHRWIRGDWQVSPWLFGSVRTASEILESNPLSMLNRWKIFDNLRRSVVPVFTLAGILLGFLKTGFLWCAAIASLSVLSNMLISSLELVFRRDSGTKAKYYSTIISGFGGWLMQAAVRFILLPFEAWIALSAVITALYRMLISRRNMLQWVTAAEAEKRDKNRIVQTYVKMWACTVCGIVLILFTPYPWAAAVGLVWIFTPLFASALSREIKESCRISEKDIAYLKESGREIWSFFRDFLNDGDNWLPVDNWQEKPALGAAHRTSPTNIGLAMLSIFAALDLGYITNDEAASTAEKMLEAVESLEKWNGHLYNWYDTKTLKVMHPQYISTVDSGNLACSLTASVSALNGIGRTDLGARAEKLVIDMDFRPLFDNKRKLFYIGRSIADDKPTEGWYDLMSSEARLTSYFACASGQVPRKHWRRLSRTLVSQDNYSGMVSWTGTMFEYLMPNLLLPCYRNSLLYESSKFCVYAQKRRAVGRVWGISESCFYAFDPSLSYKYKAHGVQRLALKRKMDTEAVFSPYSAFLALPVDTAGALRDLRAMEKLGMRGKYGFYEALDFTPSRQTSGKYKLVRSYMAHHLGMSLISIDNLLNKNIMQRRFMENREMAAYEELLQEKVPLGVLVLRRSPRDIPDKPVRIQNDEWRMELEGTDIYTPRCVTLSNGAYSVLLSETGASESRLNDTEITRCDIDLFTRYCGITFMLRVGDKAYCLTPAPDYDKNVSYSAVLNGSESSIFARFSDFKTTSSVKVPADENGEIRNVTVEYSGSEPVDCELLCFFEPVLDNRRSYEAHRAFSRMLLEFTSGSDHICVRRRPRGNTPERYLYMKCSRKCGFEISESKVFGRGDTVILKSADGEFVRAASYDACIFAETPLHLEPRSKNRITFTLAAALNAGDALSAAERLQNEKPSESASMLDLTAAGLGMSHRDINAAFSLLTELRFISKGRKESKANFERVYSQKDLWRFGISGDNPLASVRVDNEENADAAENILKKFAFLSKNGYGFDLAFVMSDGADYRSPLYRTVYDFVRVLGLESYVGSKCGLHFSDCAKENCEAIFTLSDTVIDLNSPQDYIRNTERPFTLNTRQRLHSDDKPKISFKHGKFSFICSGALPEKTWTNILTNGRFGYIASDAGTGHMWLDNARENKINAWLNDSRTTTGTETLELIKGSTRISLFAAEDGHAVKVTYSPGSARWEKKISGMYTSVRAFVPLDINARVLIIDLESSEENNRIAYCTGLVLGAEDRQKKSVITRFEKGMIKAVNSSDDDTGVFSLGADIPIRAWTTDRTEWASGELRGYTGSGMDACAAMVFDVSRRLIIVSGYLTTEDLAYLCDAENAEHELKRAEKYWLKRSSPVIIETQDKALDNFINSWALYQTEACRVDGRTSVYQSGGAFGFRDQLQDACALIWTDPSKALNIIVKAAGHQYEEGDVQHWWHESRNNGPDKGVRTRYTDDLLWLPYALCTYTEMTGDAEAVNRQCGFIKSKPLDNNEGERYETPQSSEKTASLFEHAKLSCDTALSRGTGKHGLCLFGGGDWNDGMNLVGIGGSGESVWLTWFLSFVLKKMGALAGRIGEEKTALRYTEESKRLSAAADAAWDGKWYLRGYYDSGAVLGGRDSDECCIDSVAQSFSVPGGGSKERSKAAVLAAYDELYDEKNGLALLLKPPFDRGLHDPGYIKGYAPGLRENGGQYSHAAVWLARALLETGECGKGWTVLKTMLPQNRDLSAYAAEPFVLAADIYSAHGLEGCGGWSWYTGTAGWYYRTVLEGLLGIRLQDGRIVIKPNLPPDWDGYRAKIELNGKKISIEVSRVGEKYRIVVDGHEYSEDFAFVNN